jgi:hypothetical protein
MEGYGLIVALVLLIGASVAGWYGIAAAFRRDAVDTRFVQYVFIAALWLRVAVAVGTFYWLPYGYMAPDEAGYVAEAKVLLASGHLSWDEMVNGHGWQYFNLLLLEIFGANPLVPRLWNCLIGAVLAVFCFSLARNFGAGADARWAATLAAAFPSVVLWSSLNLKDADVWVLTLGGLLVIIRMQESRGTRFLLALATFALIIVALGPLRWYASVSLLSAAAAGLLARGLRPFAGRTGFRLGLAGLVVALVGIVICVAYVFPSVGASLFRSTNLGKLAIVRHNFAIGAQSAVNPDPGLQTLAGTLAFLPSGLRDFFLRPFPWDTGHALFELARAEAIVYYPLLLLAAVGIVHSLRRRTAQTIPPLVVLLVAGIGYGLVIANLGTLYRERSQVLAVIFAFVGVGIHVIRAHEPGWRRRGRESSPEPLIRTKSASTEDSATR